MALSSNPSRKQAEIGFALVLLVAAVWAWVEAGNYPGPSATYPRALAVMLGIGALAVILRAGLAFPAGDTRRLLDHPGRFVLGFGVILAYIVAIGSIGYILPSFVLGVGLPVLLGYRNLRLVLPVVTGTLLFIFVVFKVLLERPLPPDVLDPLLEVML